MTDQERERLALEILSRTLETVQGWAQDYFHECYELESGEPVPVYAGLSQKGHGGFKCHFFALGTIKTIITDCETVFNEFLGSISPESWSEPTRGKIIEYLEGSREELVEQMARDTALHLIAFFRSRLEHTIEDALEDCKFIANSLIAGNLAYELNRILPQFASADATFELQAIGKKASERKIAWLASHVEGLPDLITKRKRGARPKAEFVRQMESQNYKQQVEVAYRKLREKNGRPPTKTSMADELGEGGLNPKTGSDTRLNAFNLKLKRLGLNYEEIVKGVEDETTQ